MRTAAIIPAGGSGKRMRGSTAKQYIVLDGVPILARTLSIFQGSSDIDDIFLVVPKDDIEFVRKMIVEEFDLSKVRGILEGGKERQDSVRNGVNVLEDGQGVVFIHDGVRPFISGELIHAALLEISKWEAVTTGVPITDTVKSTDGRNMVTGTLDRDRLWLTQTPQVFKRNVIREAHDAAFRDRHYGTDDASLVERIGINVKMILGSYYNIKITTKEDLELAEVIMRTLKPAGRFPVL